MYSSDQRVVITLDAGGTNFVFGAIRANEFIIEPITLPANANDLAACLGNLEKGFRMVLDQVGSDAVAISFAFPGPADYPNGIIGTLPNFPAFRGGVAMGPFLEEKFSLPVFINNDGDLYAYGEAIAGILPDVNRRLEEAGSAKRYKNLIGYTLGTGFGCGISTNGKMHLGDNSCGGETWCLRNKLHPNCIVEESVSIRALKRVYAEHSGMDDHDFEPKELFEIAEGVRLGNQQAAIRAFEELGQAAGDAMSNAVTLVDGIIAIGGGLTGAGKYIVPAIIKEMNSKIYSIGGEEYSRTPLRVYNLDDPKDFGKFARGDKREIKVPFSDKKVTYDPISRIGIAISKLGASKAISLGAYAFALNKIDNQ